MGGGAETPNAIPGLPQMKRPMSPQQAEDQQDRTDASQQRQAAGGGAVPGAGFPRTRKRLNGSQSLSKQGGGGGGGTFDESKHPRGYHGRFGSGGGAGTTPAGQMERQDLNNADQGILHQANEWMKSKFNAVSQAVRNFNSQHEEAMTVAEETAVSIGAYKVFGKKLAMLALRAAALPVGGPVAEIGVIIAEDVAYTAAQHMVEVMHHSNGMPLKDARDMLVQVGESMRGDHQQGVEKAAPDEQQQQEDDQQPDDKKNDQQQGGQQLDMDKALEALIHGLKCLKPSDFEGGKDKDTNGKDDEGDKDEAKSNGDAEPARKRLRKVVPYAQVRPYMDEDTFIQGRSGASTGAMRANDYFSERRGVLEPDGLRHGVPGRLGWKAEDAPHLKQGSLSNSEVREGAGVPHGDSGTPGSATNVMGRPRVV